MEMIKKAVKATLVLALLGSSVWAQSLADAKKAIDAEQYQNAKIQLKGLINLLPNPENYFFLGQVYLKTDYPDSAKVTFNKGITINPAFSLNYVGLGQVDLEDNNEAAAKTNFEKAIALSEKKDNRALLYIGKAYTSAQKPNYELAVTYLQRALTNTAPKGAELFLADVNLALGDAYRGQMKNSEAYSAYRTAYDLNKALIRSKVELGVINKMSKAFQESVDEFNAVLAIDPNYGPAYRELAETYYLWARDQPRDYDARIKQALDYYKKYLELTDRSLESRMRYADFLILAKDYKTLQQEAQAMAQMDKANKRILRYLGYAAFENGDYNASIQAIKEFMAKVDPKRVIGRDYLYLGRAEMKAGQDVEGMQSIRKAVQIDSTNTGIMSDVGKELYGMKKYAEAAEAYEIAVKNPQRNLLDYYYLGSAFYFDFGAKKTAGLTADKELLVKADSAFSYLIQRSPNTHAAWQFRGRINRQFDDENDSKGLAVPFYEKYVELITVTKPELATKNAPGLIEAYTYLGSVAARKDRDFDKAKLYFGKVLELDPANAVVLQAMKAIGGGTH
ncbi:MAG: tetratricopeptide repeat protein [Sphingobacteriaceae bacterium]